jgi:hypothetical protein
VKKLTVAAFVVLLAACSGGKTVYEKAKVPKTFNLRVDVRLSGAANVHGDLTTCRGLGKWADIAAKTKVVVTNRTHQPLASGYIANGLGTDYFHNVLDECTFRIYVFGVPRANGYTMAVGSHTPVPFTRAGLVATNGIFSFDLNTPNVPQQIYTTTTTKPKK